MLNLSDELPWQDREKFFRLMKKNEKGGQPLSAITSISKKRSTLAKQQDKSKNETTGFEEKAHEG